MTLFKTTLVGFDGFVRVTNTPAFIEAFRNIYMLQKQVLYNHSPIFPFAYLNLGRLKLYLNKDFYGGNCVIPVVRKFESRVLSYDLDQKPRYEIHAPFCTVTRLLETVKQLDAISAEPVIITDLTEADADFWLTQIMTNCAGVPYTGPKWIKVKTSDDIVQDAEALTNLAGRNFSSLRNTLKHVRNDLAPRTDRLSPLNYKDACSVFYAWKEKQGKKYFRVTIGRDIRLMEEYKDKLDFHNYFGYVHYVEDISQAVSFGCRSWKDPAWGIDVTVKANTDCKGLADYAFIHLMQQMFYAGIKYVNDSGGSGKVKLNKIKFHPVGSIPMYNLVRK